MNKEIDECLVVLESLIDDEVSMKELITVIEKLDKLEEIDEYYSQQYSIEKIKEINEVIDGYDPEGQINYILIIKILERYI